MVATIGTPDDREGRALLGQVRYYEAIMWQTFGDFARARDRARESMELGREVGEQWIVAGGEMTLGASLLGLGETATGRAVLVSAHERAEVVGQSWAAAMADLLLARSMLTAAVALPAAQRSAEVGAALPVLRRALARFLGEDDVSNVLGSLQSGALALVLAGRAAEGARMLAGVRRIAVRRGLRPDATDPAGAAALAAALTGTAEPPGEPPDLDAMIAVLEA
jgi:hypothetical protein